MSEKVDADFQPSCSTSMKDGIKTKNELKMEFIPGSMLEARDFNSEWFSAKIVEVDWEDREVLVHFQNWSSRFDEWISMDSARLRPVSQIPEANTLKSNRGKDFKVGEKVMAVWNDNKKYPAQITKILEGGNFEVLFYDGFVMQVKGKQISRLPKEQAEKLEIPFSTPDIEKEKYTNMEGNVGSKEERRKRKKKLEVSTLFRCYKKRPSGDDLKFIGSDDSETNSQHFKGDGTLETSIQQLQDMPVKKRERAANKDKGDTLKLNDSKLPAGWEKRAKFKTCGTKAGKWDVVIVGPEGRTFRSRQDIKQYLVLHQLNYDPELFDFRLGEDFYRERGIEPPKRAKDDYIAPGFQKQHLKNDQPMPVANNELESATFVPEHDGYRCPLEDCRKLFRRDNLLLMHIKHYHPALLKKLGCKTLRVEDLAAARTAFETDDVKPSIYAQSILSALMSPSPQSPLLGEKKLDRNTDSPISEDLLNVPLSKRVTLTQNDGCIKTTTVISTTSTKTVRRRTEKGNLSDDIEELSIMTNGMPTSTPVNLTEREIEETIVQKAEKESSKPETVISLSVLDDIPGQKELVHCFCGSSEEDGLMIQCELCLCWQHGICLGIDTEDGVPDPYVCHFCRYPYRERLSQRYCHDQSWLKKGNLPCLKFVTGANSVMSDKSLRVAHALAAAASDLKQLLHSLKVKIDIAKNKDHHKLYLWAKPWNSASDFEDPKLVVGNPSDVSPELDLVPNIPLPEAPINAIDCRLNLLAHIRDMQNEVDLRLETLETLLEECEREEGHLDTTQIARMQILLKDVNTLKKMASFSWISCNS